MSHKFFHRGWACLIMLLINSDHSSSWTIVPWGESTLSPLLSLALSDVFVFIFCKGSIIPTIYLPSAPKKEQYQLTRASPLLKVEIPCTKEGFPFIHPPSPQPPLSSGHKGWWELKGGNIFNFSSSNQPPAWRRLFQKQINCKRKTSLHISQDIIINVEKQYFVFLYFSRWRSRLSAGRVIGSTSSMSLSTNLTYVHIHQPDILASRPNNSYCRYHPTQFFWWPPYFSLLVFHLFFSSLFSHGFFICLLSRPLCYEKSPSVTHQAWELFSSW